MVRNIKKTLLIVISLLLIVGCSNKKEENKSKSEYYDNSEYIAVDVIANNVLCFDLVFFTANKVESVEFIGFAGEGVKNDSFEVSVINNTLDIYRDHEYKDLYCSDWMFECKPDEDTTQCSINLMELKLDGEIKQIVFNEPLKYRVGEGNDIFNEELQPIAFPNEFASSMINSGESAIYSYIANNDVVLNEVIAGADIDVEVKIYLNEDKTQEYSLPLKVKSGTKVDMEIAYKSNAQNRFSYVLSNLYITYSVGEEKYTKKGVFVFSPTSPVDEKLKKIDAYIDEILGE